MKEKLALVFNDYIKFPAFILTHPFDGFDDLKTQKKGKLSVAIIFMVLYALLRIFTYQYEGFLINERNPLNLNNLQEILSVVLIVGLFVTANWSVTTLMEGKGKFKEIFIVTGYALFPLIIIGFPGLALSNFLTLEEMPFYTLLMGIAYFLTGWMLFMGILNIHEYGLFKTVLAFIATIVSMLVMIFLGLLFFDLIQQFIAFITAIIEELGLRR
ncbi:YIP1 family protein [Acholeplasma equirhinis]|uniref:YIP1 family protein n=1 Tax=Acholeplasma equirhinis TaxID=555393 RepID=UPI00197AA0C6|nr:YIP1 family protein [Acholeplasma equirhinis]MBN3490766.1 YIP1 family protein [Acholeplasma equirhinis]